MIGMVSHGHGFLKTLSFIIDSSWSYRVYISPVSLWLWVNRWITINL